MFFLVCSNVLCFFPQMILPFKVFFLFLRAACFRGSCLLGSLPQWLWDFGQLQVPKFNGCVLLFCFLWGFGGMCFSLFAWVKRKGL